MSNRAERTAEDAYERDNDSSPVSGTLKDNSYAKETNPGLRDQIPVQGDDQRFEDPIQPPYLITRSSSVSLSNYRTILWYWHLLEEDESEAIDNPNILKGDRLRHAKPGTSNKYNEGPDEDDLMAES